MFSAPRSREPSASRVSHQLAPAHARGGWGDLRARLCRVVGASLSESAIRRRISCDISVIVDFELDNNSSDSDDELAPAFRANGTDWHDETTVVAVFRLRSACSADNRVDLVPGTESTR